LAIRDGRVAALVAEGDETSIAAERMVDVGGRIIFPGVIDEHVHFSEVGQEFEGYEAGSKARRQRRNTVLEMPLNDLPPTTNMQALRTKGR